MWNDAWSRYPLRQLVNLRDKYLISLQSPWDIQDELIRRSTQDGDQCLILRFTTQVINSELILLNFIFFKEKCFEEGGKEFVRHFVISGSFNFIFTFLSLVSAVYISGSFNFIFTFLSLVSAVYISGSFNFMFTFLSLVSAVYKYSLLIMQFIFKKRAFYKLFSTRRTIIVKFKNKINIFSKNSFWLLF